MSSRRASASTARRVATVAVVAATAALAAGCDGLQGKPGAPGEQGPVLFLGAEARAMAGFYADAGERVVFGVNVVRNDGDRPATLTGATLVGDVDPADAHVAAVRVLDLTEPHDKVGAAPWPFEDYERASVPLPGFELAPGREAELLYVVDVVSTGEWTWPQSTVRYRIGDDEHIAFTSVGFQVCPTTETADFGC